MMKLLNKVAVQDSVFDDRGWRTKTPWAVVALKVGMAAQPYEVDRTQRVKAMKHVRKIGLPLPGMMYDVPQLYAAENTDSDAVYEVNSKMVLGLLSQVALVLRGLLKNPDRPREVIWPISEHFEAIGSAPLKVDFSLAAGSSSPELFFITPGLDSLAWRTFLDFCADRRATWRNIVGDCALCRKLFEKSRSDKRYCCDECRARASYSTWKKHGGLSKRKEKRKQ